MTRAHAPAPIRVLWVCKHRTARYEEVGALLREGLEVIPVAGESAAFPNAVALPDGVDPWMPPWRATCSAAAEDVELLRAFEWDGHGPLPDHVEDALNHSVDVVLVATFTSIAHRVLRSRFRGVVILRPYGGYPYSTSLGWWLPRELRLRRFADSDRYYWCPAIPYQSLIEDPRLTRGETFWAGTVSRDRLGATWLGAESEPAICEVISLIAKYRRREYARFLELHGALPVRILGQNPRGGESGTDARVVGTLSDADYYAAMAGCRAMLYAGLGSKYHLHYHAVEAIMMRVPVVFFADSAIAHTARYLGANDERLREIGMVSTADEANRVASSLLEDVRRAIDLSARQQELRDVYAPERWDPVIGNLIRDAVARPRYRRAWATGADRPPPRGAAGLIHGTVSATRNLMSRALRRGA